MTTHGWAEGGCHTLATLSRVWYPDTADDYESMQTLSSTIKGNLPC
jgi:hypothetical protein